MTATAILTASAPLLARDVIALVMSGQPYAGNSLYTPWEWSVACRHADQDGYHYEVQLMLERDGEFVPSVDCGDSYAPGTSPFEALFAGMLPFDAAPDLTALRSAVA